MAVLDSRAITITSANTLSPSYTSSPAKALKTQQAQLISLYGEPVGGMNGISSWSMSVQASGASSWSSAVSSNSTQSTSSYTSNTATSASTSALQTSLAMLASLFNVDLSTHPVYSVAEFMQYVTQLKGKDAVSTTGVLLDTAV